MRDSFMTVRSGWIAACGLCLPLWAGSVVWGQTAINPGRLPRPTPLDQVRGGPQAPRTGGSTTTTSRGPKTSISVELLTGDEGMGYTAHRWHQVFERLQIELLIRRAAAGEEIETTEQTTPGIRGATRKVLVRGKLEKSGRLVFSDRAFTEAQAGQLARWLRELQDFGYQGSPKGQPVWGLSKDQFSALFSALAVPVTETTADKSLPDAVTALGLPSQYRLSYSAGASKYQSPQQVPSAGSDEAMLEYKIQQSVAGIAKGTALAVVLSEHGLGFRPRRLADGQIDLQICTLTENSDVWPVGWPQLASNMKTAPKYYALMKIDLHDVMLDEVLSAASDLVGIPILVDRHALAARQIDLSQVKVGHRPKQTTWSLALQELTFQAKMQPHLYIDEGGKPLVWVTPLGTVRKVRASGQ